MMGPAKRIVLCLFVLCAAGGMTSSCANIFKRAPKVQDQPGDPVQTETPDESPGTGESDRSIEALKDKIDALEQKVDTLESQMAGQKDLRYTMENSDPAQAYQKARNLLLENDIDNAANLFAAFVERHPGHALADNALYWLGEYHYTQGRYKDAIRVFKELVTAYPKAEKVPDALLKIGYAYLSLDDINRANHFLKRVITKYPFSPAAAKAEKKLAVFE